MIDIFQLYLSNKVEKPSVMNLSVDGNKATISLQGIVYPEVGINAMDVRNEIAKAGDVETIIFNINTPGGSVFEGREVMDVIRNTKAKTIAHIGSLCASAGTSIALACDEVEMANGAHFMIHNAHGIGSGDKSDLRKAADFLEKIEMSIIEDYTSKTGKDAEEIASMMEEETWMTASEALKNGFIDRISSGKQGASNAWNLALYKNAPKVPEPENQILENQVPEPVEEKPEAVSATQRNTNALKLVLI